MIPIWALAEQSGEELSRESLQKVGKVRVRPGRCPTSSSSPSGAVQQQHPQPGDNETSKSCLASHEDNTCGRAVLGAGTPKLKVPSARLLRAASRAGCSEPAHKWCFSLGPPGSLKQIAGANVLITGAEFSEESELLLNIRSQPFG